MPNTKDPAGPARHRILIVGGTGSGKTSQIWSLPGRKFAYIFDPNSLSTLRGLDMEYKEFYPDFLEMDATLKGFNKDKKTHETYKGDKPSSRREPTIYLKWVEDINKMVESGELAKNFDWLIMDSLTFLTKAVMDRQLFINNRYGDIEDLADYRIVGSKMADVFNSIVGLPINIYATGHITSFQDEKTKKIETQLNLPGKARTLMPLMFTDILMAQTDNEGKDTKYQIRTKPDSRGFKDIRSSMRGLKDVEDVTIRRFDSSAEGSAGIGALLKRGANQGQPAA